MHLFWLLLALHVVHVDPDLLTPSGSVTTLRTEAVSWHWVDGLCAPVRMTGSSPREWRCERPVPRPVRIGGASGDAVYTVRGGTETMIREVPTTLLPSVAVRGGALASLTIPEGRGFIRVDGPGAATNWEELKQTTVLYPETGRSVHLRVTADDHRQLQGCSTRLTIEESTTPRALPFLAVCDAQNVLTLPTLPERFTYRARVYANGALPRTVVSRLIGFEDIELHRGASLHGRTTDSRHQPLAAAVEVRFPADGEWVVQHAQAARDGAFTIAGVLGNAELSAAKEHYAVAVQRITACTGESLDLGDVVLPHSAVLNVRVTGARGEPIAGARLWTRATAATTSSEGLASLTDVADSGETLHARARGYLPLDLRAAPARDGAVTTVRMEPAAGIRFRAVRGTGHAPGPGTVLLEHDGATRNEGLPDTGVFEAYDLPPGDYSLEVHVQDASALRVGPRTVHAGQILDLGTLELASGHAITGMVVDASDGSSVAGSSLMAVPEGEAGAPMLLLQDARHEAAGDEAGHFRVTGLSAGTFTLVATAPGHAPGIRTITVSGDRDTDAGSVPLPRARTLVIHCRPISDCRGEARLLAGGTQHSWAGTAATLYDGVAQLTPVAAGTFPLRLSDGQKVYYQQDVTVSERVDTTEITIELSKTTLHGIVICDGRRQAGGTVTLQRDIAERLVTMNRSTSLGTTFMQNVTPFAPLLAGAVGADGSFTIEGVGPGGYLATYQNAGGTALPQAITVPEASSFELTLVIEGSTLSGIVFDASGRPATAAHVVLSDLHRQLASSIVGPDGTFRFLGVAPGAYVFQAERGRESATMHVTTPREDPLSVVLSVSAIAKP